MSTPISTSRALTCHARWCITREHISHAWFDESVRAFSATLTIDELTHDIRHQGFTRGLYMASRRLYGHAYYEPPTELRPKHEDLTRHATPSILMSSVSSPRRQGRPRCVHSVTVTLQILTSSTARARKHIRRAHRLPRGRGLRGKSTGVGY